MDSNYRHTTRLNHVNSFQKVRFYVADRFDVAPLLNSGIVSQFGFAEAATSLTILRKNKLSRSFLSVSICTWVALTFQHTFCPRGLRSFRHGKIVKALIRFYFLHEICQRKIIGFSTDNV